MTTINDPTRASRLARAIASDILLYNDEKLRQGGAVQNPFLLLSETLIEGYELFKGRVSPEHWSSFSVEVLSIFARSILKYEVPQERLKQYLATALGAFAAEAGLASYAPVASSLAPEPPKEIMRACARCGKENQSHYKYCLSCGDEIDTLQKDTPQKSSKDDIIKQTPAKRGGFEQGRLWLLPGLLVFEDASGTREEHSLENLRELKITRAFGGELELRLNASYQERHFTFTSSDDLAMILSPLLLAL